MKKLFLVLLVIGLFGCTDKIEITDHQKIYTFSDASEMSVTYWSWSNRWDVDFKIKNKCGEINIKKKGPILSEVIREAEEEAKCIRESCKLKGVFHVGDPKYFGVVGNLLLCSSRRWNEKKATQTYALGWKDLRGERRKSNPRNMIEMDQVHRCMALSLIEGWRGKRQLW